MLYLGSSKVNYYLRALLAFKSGLKRPIEVSLKSQKAITRPVKANLRPARTDSGLRRLILCSNRVYYDLRATSDFKSG